MAKFKVLKYNESILIHLGIFSNRRPDGSMDRRLFIPLRVCYISFISASFVVAASMFVYQNSQQFTLALRTCEFLFGCSQAVSMLICFVLNTSKIQIVHLKLQELVDKSTECMY